MRFAVCAFLDDVALDAEFDAGALPLHVTLLGNATIGAEQGQLEAVLEAVAAGYPPFEAEGGDDALFGPDGDVEVTLVEDDGSLLRAHLELLGMLRPLGLRPDAPAYAGRGFRPHVTVVDGDRIDRGEAFELDALALIDLEPDGDATRRRVAAQLPLI
jgi:2'-5' RNA ligase